MSQAAFDFSELDLQIIEILKQDGRTNNQQIAEQTGVTTNVIASRIRRMEKAKAMKIVAVSDFSAYNYDVLLPIGIDVKGRRADDVANDLSRLEEVASVQLASGKHDIEILVTLRDLSQMNPFFLDKLSKIKGIRNLNPAIAIDIIKYDFDVAPI